MADTGLLSLCYPKTKSYLIEVRLNIVYLQEWFFMPPVVVQAEFQAK